MKDVLFLTWRHIVFNRGRVGLLVALITLAAVLPVTLEMLLDELLTSIGTESHPAGAAHGTACDPTLFGPVLDSLVTVTAVVSLILITLALGLGPRLRNAEMGVLARIGASPARLRSLLAFEVVLIGFACIVLAGCDQRAPLAENRLAG